MHSEEIDLYCYEIDKCRYNGILEKEIIEIWTYVDYTLYV